MARFCAFLRVFGAFFVRFCAFFPAKTACKKHKFAQNPAKCAKSAFMQYPFSYTPFCVSPKNAKNCKRVPPHGSGCRGRRRCCTVPRGPKDWKFSRFSSGIEIFIPQHPAGTLVRSNGAKMSKVVREKGEGGREGSTAAEGSEHEVANSMSQSHSGLGLKFSGENETFNREWNFQAGHTARALVVGNSRGRDWKFQARMKFSSENETFMRKAWKFQAFKREWKFSRFRSLGLSDYLRSLWFQAHAKARVAARQLIDNSASVGKILTGLV